jgi:hypothetical protein
MTIDEQPDSATGVRLSGTDATESRAYRRSIGGTPVQLASRPVLLFPVTSKSPDIVDQSVLAAELVPVDFAPLTFSRVSRTALKKVHAEFLSTAGRHRATELNAKQARLAEQVARAVFEYDSGRLLGSCTDASTAVTAAMNDYDKMHAKMTQCVREDEADDGFEDELLAAIDQFALSVQRTASYAIFRP